MVWKTVKRIAGLQPFQSTMQPLRIARLCWYWSDHRLVRDMTHHTLAGVKILWRTCAPTREPVASWENWRKYLQAIDAEKDEAGVGNEVAQSHASLAMSCVL